MRLVVVVVLVKGIKKQEMDERCYVYKALYSAVVVTQYG